MRLKLLSIILVCVFVMLIILDAPAYVRCIDIGICEFLDIQCHMANVLESDIIEHGDSKQSLRKGQSPLYSPVRSLTLGSSPFLKGLVRSLTKLSVEPRYNVWIKLNFCYHYENISRNS